jgi:hypothetical protein
MKRQRFKANTRSGDSPPDELTKAEAASKGEENTVSVGIGIRVAIAIGCMGLQKPIATATPIPIPMIATQSEHELRPDPHFLIKYPPIYELTRVT